MTNQPDENTLQGAGSTRRQPSGAEGEERVSSVHQINASVAVRTVALTAQTCEECGANLADVSGDSWWPEQDGTCIACPACGHTNFFPDQPAGYEPEANAKGTAHDRSPSD